MDTTPFKERMLEIENLTDELQESQATWILDWGSAQLDLGLKDVEDEETAGEKANAIYAVLRKINRMSKYADETTQRVKSTDELAAEFASLAELAGLAFSRSPNLSHSGVVTAASQLRGLQPDEAVEFLARWALAACGLP